MKKVISFTFYCSRIISKLEKDPNLRIGLIINLHVFSDIYFKSGLRYVGQKPRSQKNIMDF